MLDIHVAGHDAEVSFFVAGVPRPQGSMRAIVSKSTGRAFLKNSSDTLAPWRNQIVQVATEGIEDEGWSVFPSGPLELEVVFFFDRPKSHPKKRRAIDRGIHYKMPDIDKLVRAVGDALSVSALIGDDDQIATLHAYKRYAEEGTSGAGMKVWLRRVPGGYIVGEEFRK